MNQQENNPGVTPEQATPSQPEATPPQTETQPTNTTPAQESAPQTSAVSSQTTSAPQTSVVPPQTTTAPQSGVVEGKKSHAGIIVLIVVLVVLLLLGGLAFVVIKTVTGTVKNIVNDVTSSITDETEGGIDNGGNSNSGTTPADNPINAANDKMRNELGSFDYTATITSNAMNMDIDTVMNCTVDGKSKIEYCKTELFMGMSQEIYFDYGNGVEYMKSVSPYSFAPVDEGWTKISLPAGTTGGVDIANGTSFKDIASEKVDGGTVYKGTLSGFTDGTVNVNNGSLSSVSMNYEIFINDDGYIKTINMTTESDSISQTVKVEYSNFGTARSLTIPAEALNN